jgi:uncharacterized protein (DUF983 family)
MIFSIHLFLIIFYSAILHQIWIFANTSFDWSTWSSFVISTFCYFILSVCVVLLCLAFSLFINEIYFNIVRNNNEK